MGVYYEYISPVKVFGLPLVHVRLGFGPRLAKGIVAIGNCAVGVVALGAFTLILQRRGGKLGKRRLLSAKANYALLYIAGAVTLCAILTALLLGVTAAYWALFLVVAWLFGAAVYYTVRLM